MADYSIYQIAIGETGTTYPQKYDNFRIASEARAQEVEDARESHASNTLLGNLQTYAKYTLAANILGGATWKCTGMPNGTLGSQDYCTVAQAEGLIPTGPGITSITDLVPGGNLNANDVLVVADDGFSIVGRPTTYTKLTLATTNVVALSLIHI